MLINDTAGELIDLVSDFSFDDIGSQDISFLLINPDGSIRKLDLDSDLRNINRYKPLKFLVHGWQEAGKYFYQYYSTNTYYMYLLTKHLKMQPTFYLLDSNCVDQISIFFLYEKHNF